jgi:hypothetical protein
MLKYPRLKTGQWIKRIKEKGICYSDYLKLLDNKNP